MSRRQFDEDWKRKKEYLVQPVIAEPVLSSIPEHQEPSSFVDQPHESDGPLSELIVEREKRRRHDKSNKFYDKLEIKMKKFYRKVFLGEDVDMGDSISENDSRESSTNDAGSSTAVNRSEGEKHSMDDIITILDKNENSDQSFDAEPDDTPLARSHENNDDSQTTTTASENEKGNTLVVKAMVHATEDMHQEEPEPMRKQRPYSIEELLHSDGDNTPKHLRPDTNSAYHTMEQMEEVKSLDSTSPINSPTSMVNSITQATPMRLKSPILGQKRPSTNLYHKSNKKRKVSDAINSIFDKNDTIGRNVSTSNIKGACLFTQDVEVQVHRDMNHIEIQTESNNLHEVGIQTDEPEEYVRCTNASTQTEPIGRRDQGTQTGGRFFEYSRFYNIFDSFNIFE